MPARTIKSLLAEINNEDAEGGGLWLPNIQRLFVWSEEQIEKLFDSIMRQYPLPSMMLWKTRDEAVRHRRFIDQFHENFDLKGLYRQTNKKMKKIVLDGQQRLQSLYIGLKGSIDGREMYFDLLSGNAKSPEEICYRFEFKHKKEADWPWIRFGELIYSRKLADEIAQDVMARANSTLSQDERRTVTRNISRAKKELEITEALLYQEIDGTDEEAPYEFGDIVEIFIRANSGGTKLSRSDLMFTLLIAQWDLADVEMDQFVSEVNDNRFDFSRDFVLKTAMTVLDKGAKYDVDKLRDDKLRTSISDNWKRITDSIRVVRDQIVSKTFIRSDRALPSYNALIPLVYFHFHFPEEWKSFRPVKEYLLRALLAGAFSGRPDGLIDKITKNIRERGTFDRKAVFRVIEEDGRNLEISKATLWDMGYGSGQIHLLFNLWYDVDYKPLYFGHLPQVDHIFPQSLLKAEKLRKVETGRRVQRFSASEINQLANCMLLTAKENGASGKGDIPPDEWLADKDADYLNLHCIPAKKSFWTVDNFEQFIEARKELIADRFRELLLYDGE
jgi:uncharacterized protein DUF262/uncharacterized protein DUF1524